MSRLLLVLVSGLLLGGCATYGASSGRVVIQDDTSRVDIRIDDNDRALIEQYYRKHKKGLPPGLAKRNQLPPGLAKRDKLPPGLHGQALPDELESRLSRLPGNYVRVRVGSDIVLMDGRTRVIFDVVHDVAY